MFGFLKRKKHRRDQQDREEQQQSEQQDSAPTPEDTEETARERPVESREGPGETPAPKETPAPTPERDDAPEPAHGGDAPAPSPDRPSTQTPGTDADDEPRTPRDTEPASDVASEPVIERGPEAEPTVERDTTPVSEPDPESSVERRAEPDVVPEPVDRQPPEAPSAPEEVTPEETSSKPAADVPAPPETPAEDAPEAPPEDATTGGVASEVTTPARNRGRDKPRRARYDTDIEVGPETAGEQGETASAKKGWFSRMRQGLGKTRSNLTDGLATLLLGHKEIDDDLLEELETQLLMADVGVAATSEIMENLEGQISRRELKNVDALYKSLQQELSRMLEPVAKPLRLPPKGEGPFVILTVGVNGVGKTTTIGKLTQRFQRQGRSVMLAAGDTFRAAAVEQLQVWGERNDVPVIAQHTGADSASVIYDAVSAAKARGIDVLIADTAGRLHNKNHLMDELSKVQRVMARLDAQAPHEVMLVLDAGTGQNAISQAETFNQAVPVTGITLTKLDGTAKGGIIFAIAKQLGTPIRYIGVGETLDDLRPFEAEDFVSALFDRDGS
ncbi:signal recognition particle-docking protein FtsY [Kushneria sp. AK178]